MQLTLSLQQKVLIMQISFRSSTALLPLTTRDMPTAVSACRTQVAGGPLCRCRARTSPCPKALVFPVHKESEGEIKCTGRRMVAGDRAIGRPDSVPRAIGSGHLLDWNTFCLTPWTHSYHSLAWNHFRSLLQNRDPTMPRGAELNQALSARLWCQGDFWQTSQTQTILPHLAAEAASVPGWS